MSKLVLETNPIKLEKATSTEVSSSSTTIVPVKQDSIVEGLKKEYSVVGDGLYASVSAEEAPQWLLSILDNVISAKLDANLASLEQANLNIINSLSDLDIAKNQYQELINIEDTIDSVIASKLITLNATVDDNTASIMGLDVNKVTENEAIAISADVVQASLDSGAINARVGNVETALTDTNIALSSTTTALEAQFDDVSEVTSALENSIIATADKAEANFAYNATVTLNGTSYKTGFGLATSITDPQIPVGTSEFWVNAEKFKMVSPNQSIITVNDILNQNIHRGAWAAATLYNVSDIVQYGGSSYICSLGHTSGTVFEDTNWDLMAVAGRGTESVRLYSSAQAFVVDKDDNHVPNNIVVTAFLSNLSGPVNWHLDPAVAYTTEGNTLTISKAAMGSNKQVTVTANVTGNSGTVTDKMSIYQLTEGKYGLSYHMITDKKVLKLKKDSTFENDTIVVHLYAKAGDLATENYTGVIKVYEDDTLVSTTSGNSKVHTVTSTDVKAIRVKGFLADGTTRVDEEVIPVVVDGSDSITVDLHNDNHTFAASVGGSVGSYAGSSTVVDVYLGSNKLDAKNNNAAFVSSDKNVFRVVSVTNSSGVVGNSISVSAGVATVGNVTNMTVDQGTRTIVVAVRDAKGEEITSSIVQTVSKAKSGTDGKDGTDGVDGKDGTDGVDGKDGTDGVDGTNTAVLYLYQRSVASPNRHTSNRTYTFSTGTYSGSFNNGWVTTIPAGTDPVWVMVTTAVSQNSSVYISSTSWADPVKLTENGVDGATGEHGINTATVYLYRTTTTPNAPALPTNTSVYEFSSSSFTAAPNNSWVTSLANAGTGNYRWMIQATAASSSDTDSIGRYEWSAPALLSTDGEAGTNTATLYLYNRTTATPSAVNVTRSYTFSTRQFSSSFTGGWVTEIPTGTAPIWVTVVSVSSKSDTVSIPSSSWASPVKLSENGEPGSDGINGLNVATLYLYRRTTSSTSPNVPSDTVTYNFDTNSLTDVNNSWTRTLPTTGGSYRWMTMATASSVTHTDSIASSEWSAPVLIAEDGKDGEDGTDGKDGKDGEDSLTILNSNQAHTLPANADGYVELHNYTGSGTSIKVLEGVTALTRVTGTVGNGQYTVTTSVNPVGGIVVGTPTWDNGSRTLIYGNHSSMTSDSVTITYTFAGKYSDGTELNATTTQTLTKSKAGWDMGFEETFETAVVNGKQVSGWNNSTPTTAGVLTVESGGSYGGKVLKSSGGRTWLYSNNLVPVDDSLFELKVRVRQEGGSGGQYIGIRFLDSNKVPLLSNVSHYIVHNSTFPPAFTLYTAYYKRGGTGNASNFNSPRFIPAEAAYIQVSLPINYSLSTAGDVYIDYVAVNKLSTNAVDMLNSGLVMEATTSGITFNSAGSIKSNGMSSNPVAGTSSGVFMGYTGDGSGYEVFAGNSANYMHWNGSNLKIKGDIEGSSISIGLANNGQKRFDVQTDGTMTIRDTAGNTILSSGSSAAIPTSAVDGLGSLATKNSVNYGTEVTSKPTSLSGINSAEGTKLLGIGVGATRNIVSTGTAAPSGGSNGDMYIQTLADSPNIEWIKVGTTWQKAATVNDKITANNINTYMANGAISTTYIGHAQVDTLRIGDDAVSVIFKGIGEYEAIVFAPVPYAAEVHVVGNFVQGDGKPSHRWNLTINGVLHQSEIPQQYTLGSMIASSNIPAGNNTIRLFCDDLTGYAKATLLVFVRYR